MIGLLSTSFRVGAVLLTLACSNPVGPRAVPIQFQSVTGGQPPPPPPVIIAAEPRAIRITGGYEAGGCGPAGAVAESVGTTLQITVGASPPDPDCDAVRLVYTYEAVLVGIDPGRYTIEVYHRQRGGPDRQLALRQDVTVQ